MKSQEDAQIKKLAHERLQQDIQRAEEKQKAIKFRFAKAKHQKDALHMYKVMENALSPEKKAWIQETAK